jgi:hypothetical protein
MTTCAAPTLSTCSDVHSWNVADTRIVVDYRDPRGLIAADGPSVTCQGTEWPPPTSWARYAQDRASGSRVPPSVSAWRPEDARRQMDADRRLRERAPAKPAVVAWEPGPACDDRKAVR